MKWQTARTLYTAMSVHAHQRPDTVHTENNTTGVALHQGQSKCILQYQYDTCEKAHHTIKPPNLYTHYYIHYYLLLGSIPMHCQTVRRDNHR